VFPSRSAETRCRFRSATNAVVSLSRLLTRLAAPPFSCRRSRDLKELLTDPTTFSSHPVKPAGIFAAFLVAYKRMPRATRSPTTHVLLRAPPAASVIFVDRLVGLCRLTSVLPGSSRGRAHKHRLPSAAQSDARIGLAHLAFVSALLSRYETRSVSTRYFAAPLVYRTPSQRGHATLSLGIREPCTQHLAR